MTRLTHKGHKEDKEHKEEDQELLSDGLDWYFTTR